MSRVLDATSYIYLEREHRRRLAGIENAARVALQLAYSTYLFPGMVSNL